jgi:hypothetical protein
MKLAFNKRAEQLIVEVPTIIGTSFEGGYYFGRMMVGVDAYALVVPVPMAHYIKRPFSWSETSEPIAGARSYCDGLANTRAMAAAGSKLAQWALDQRIGGHDDWFIPSRQDALVFHSNKHLASEEYLQYGGFDGFETEYVWTSTECHMDSSFAWAMPLKLGSHLAVSKDERLRSGVVRRVKI